MLNAIPFENGKGWGIKFSQFSRPTDRRNTFLSPPYTKNQNLVKNGRIDGKNRAKIGQKLLKSDPSKNDIFETPI